MRAFLILEDGTQYEGRSIGTPKEVISEIVFNTSMTGYQEILTDPSYAGQAIVMTYPLIGNYGVCIDDMESSLPHTDGFIVRDVSRLANNWRAGNTLQNFLARYSLTGIAGIDTRDLTKRLRNYGTMNGCLTTKLYQGAELTALLEKIKSYTVSGVVLKTSTKEVKEYHATNTSKKKVALLDVGTKRNIIRCLQEIGCDVTVFPSTAKAKDIIKIKPDGIMISNGPGDPKENVELIKEIRELAVSGIPIFAICLGHQLMALAMGGDTYKMKFGHRGANHPVKDVSADRVYITSQNHGYAVKVDSLPESIAKPAFYNLNDGTNEGFRYVKENILTVQFHPEASPGPMDSRYLFGQFMEMMEGAHA